MKLISKLWKLIGLCKMISRDRVRGALKEELSKLSLTIVKILKISKTNKNEERIFLIFYKFITIAYYLIFKII